MLSTSANQNRPLSFLWHNIISENGVFQKSFPFLRLSRRECIYLLLMGLSLVVGTFRIAAYAKCLSPALMGYLSVALTVASYGALFDFGLLSGLNRELPIALGSGKCGDAARYVGETTMAIALLSVVGFGVYAAVLGSVSFADGQLRDAFVWGGLLSIVGMFFSLARLRLRAEQHILPLSATMLFDQVLTLIGGILLVRWFGYSGPIIVIIISSALLFYYSTRWLLMPVNYRDVRLAELRGLFSVGLPLMAAGLLSGFKLSLDRLFIIKTMHPQDIGVYHVGVLPLSLAIAITVICNQYVGPKLLVRYGEGHDLRYVFSRAVIVAAAVFGVMILTWPLAVPFFRFVVHQWLPAYEGSIIIFAIFYFGAAFTSANTVGIAVIAAKRQNILFVQELILTCILAGILIMLMKFQAGIMWYAIASACIQALGCISVIAIGYWCCWHRVGRSTEIRSEVIRR